MNLTDELRKLADLRKEGHLTDQEFAEAKQRLLAEGGNEPARLSNDEGAAEEAVAPIEEKTFRSSRWSSGNMIFPDSLTLAKDGMLFRKGAMFGSSEERINYRAVASLRVKNGIFLANITVETSGGSQPIFINGLWKSQAKEVQDSIRAFQNNG